MTKELTVKNLLVTMNGQFTGYCDLYNLNHFEQLLLRHFIEGLVAGIKIVYGDEE